MDKQLNGNKYIMFVDETGVSNIDKENPFAIAGVIFKEEYAFSHIENRETPLKSKLEAFKEECFDTKDIELHLLDIANRTRRFTKDKVTSAQLNFFLGRFTRVFR